MGLDTMVDMQLHLDVHDQVNVTWGLVVHIELALWITDTVCRIYQIILSPLIPPFISINVNLKKGRFILPQTLILCKSNHSISR